MRRGGSLASRRAQPPVCPCRCGRREAGARPRAWACARPDRECRDAPPQSPTPHAARRPCTRRGLRGGQDAAAAAAADGAAAG
eukprot:scaffold218_cov333-Prasinococcus_capsulatus_cf.AAC.12